MLLKSLQCTNVLLFNHVYPDKFSKGEFIDKLETRAPIYYVGFDRGILLELRASEAKCFHLQLQ